MKGRHIEQTYIRIEPGLFAAWR